MHKLMKFKAKMAVVSLSFLLVCSKSYATPDWFFELLADAVGRTVGGAAGQVIDSCGELLEDLWGKTGAPYPHKKPKLLFTVTAESLLLLQNENPEVYAEMIQVGDSLWLSRERIMRVRTRQDIQMLSPELTQILIQTGVVTQQQMDSAENFSSAP